MIKPINFEIILPIWESKLWPTRISKIETHSAMLYQSNERDMVNFSLPVWYLGAYIDNSIVGVNSGHMCSDGMARSRGLWVDSNHRNKGIGQLLLSMTKDIAKQHDAKSIWSFPRFSSKNTYESVGFKITSEWMISETSDANAYCYTEL